MFFLPFTPARCGGERTERSGSGAVCRAEPCARGQAAQLPPAACHHLLCGLRMCCFPLGPGVRPLTHRPSLVHHPCPCQMLPRGLGQSFVLSGQPQAHCSLPSFPGASRRSCAQPCPSHSAPQQSAPVPLQMLPMLAAVGDAVGKPVQGPKEQWSWLQETSPACRQHQHAVLSTCPCKPCSAPHHHSLRAFVSTNHE